MIKALREFGIWTRREHVLFMLSVFLLGATLYYRHQYQHYRLVYEMILEDPSLLIKAKPNGVAPLVADPSPKAPPLRDDPGS